MNKIYLAVAAFLLTVCTLHAQTPQSVCYQAVATDAAGTELQARNISIRATILSDAPNGTEEYIETHTVQTDDFGLFNLNIGQGTQDGGATPNFTDLDWGNHAFFLKVEMDSNGGTDYQLMGINQMLSVPYALYARGAQNAQTAQTALDDADKDPLNEIQTLTLDETTGELSLSGSNGVIIPTVADGDGDATNELQTLIYDEGAGTLSLSGGNTITLPAVVEDDPQNADEVDVVGGTYNGQNVQQALENINIALAADADQDPLNEIQTLTLNETTGELSLSGSNGVIIPTVADGDGDATNELQNADQVNVTGGIYQGQNVQEALENVGGDVSNITNQITQVINEVEADGDGDATNELQTLEYDAENNTLTLSGGNTVTLPTGDPQSADEVDIFGGAYDGQNMQQALENINAQLAADQDGDPLNEIQTADGVQVIGGTYQGQNVQEALENVGTDVSNITNQITQVINEVEADGDGDSTNELQNATQVQVTTGDFAGQSVEEALNQIQSNNTLDEDTNPLNEIQTAGEVEITGGDFNGQNVEQALGQLQNQLDNDNDSDPQNEIQNAGQVEVTGGTYEGQSVQQALEEVGTQITQIIDNGSADADADPLNEIQNADQVEVTGGTYQGQDVQEALENVGSEISNFNTQITQVINEVEADGDGDSTNEIQTADGVEITGGTYQGQDVQEALENVGSEISNFNTQITQVINEVEEDGDGDSTNEIQTADGVEITGGTYQGQDVQEALENVGSEISNFNTQITQVINEVEADGDGDSTNEIQTADGVEITGGTYQGQDVQEALENVGSEISNFNTQITQVINEVEEDGDGDSTNEIQTADGVEITGGTYQGQDVQEALENVGSEISNFNTQITQVINEVEADGDGDSTNEIQTADGVQVIGGNYQGQNVQTALDNISTDVSSITNQVTNIGEQIEQIETQADNDNDADPLNEIQTADGVQVIGGTYQGDDVQTALDDLSGNVANNSTQIDQLETQIAQDGDTDSSNEIQTADGVEITGGTYQNNDVQQALEILTAALAAGDGDSDPNNEIQTADGVQISGGTYQGSNVQAALEILTAAVAAGDGDSDPTNEFQAANQVNVPGGTYQGMNVQQALETIATALAGDNDSDPNNEIQTADDVLTTGNDFGGADVQTVLGNLQDAQGADNDGDATNEIQTANQVLTTGSQFNGADVQTVLGNLQDAQAADNDGDATNEIQELVYDGVTLGISGGNTITLSDVPLGAPGASIRYPQGIIGDYIVVTSTNYTVPAGKNFYLTGGPPTVGLFNGGNVYNHPTAPSMPILAGGQQVQNCKCLGLLIDENEVIETTLVDFQQQPVYTVPAGKVFVVKSGMVNDDVSYLVVNGVQIEFFRPNFLRASNLLSFPEGTTLEMPNNVAQMLLTGYLIEIDQ